MENIKFRAWQRDKRMMCKVRDIHFLSKQASLEEKENVINTRYFKDIKLMQFTGLYDKNRKEIYEGDIIEYSAYSDESAEIKKGIASVVWDKEETGYYLANDYKSNLFYLIKDLECEVIGNIYENYELLGKKRRKVIFLDIDGVLNNENHIINLVTALGEKQYYELLDRIKGTPFDYESCNLLKMLVDKTGAEVVLSSTWRLNPKGIEILEKYTDIKVSGATPKLDTIRGKEIKEYLDNHNEVVNYVILDDDDDMLDEQKNNFVKVNRKFGLMLTDIIKCENILEDK